MQKPVTFITKTKFNMPTLAELLKKRATLVEQQGETIETIEGESRDLTDEEQANFDDQTRQIEELDEEIKKTRKIEEAKARLANIGGTFQRSTSEEEELRKASSRYSFLNVVRAVAEGEQLKGLEAEMHEEAKKEAREFNQMILGIGIPLKMLKRSQNVSTPADGGLTVEDEPIVYLEELKKRSLIKQLGIDFVTGLKGNLPLVDGSGVEAFWGGEESEAQESKKQFSKREFSPHRNAVVVPITLQLLIQSSLDIENMVRTDMVDAHAGLLNAAMINGSGQGDVPLGLLNYPGIGLHQIGANGGVITDKDLVALETIISMENADIDNLKYATTAQGRGYLKTARVDPGSGKMLWTDNMLNGYSAVASNYIPSDLSKGTGTDLSAMIFGNWKDLKIGQWGGLDISTESKKRAGKIELILNAFNDVIVRRANSFAAIVDFDPAG